MKVHFIFIFISNFLVASCTYCPSALQGLIPKEWRPSNVITSPCPLSSDPIAKLRKLLSDHFLGQEDAVELVENYVKANILLRKKPQLLHFSGPTGVGKTHLAKLVGEALFTNHLASNSEKICGVLELRMRSLLRNIPPSQVRDIQEKELLRPIVEQLYHCPRSLIILDDIHWVDADIIDSLKSAFDAQAELVCRTGDYHDKPVSTRDAIFIATSDLEENQHQLTSNMARDEAIALIKKLAQQRWESANRQAVTVRLAAVVPFLRLSNPELEKIVEYQFRVVEEIIRDKLNRQTTQYKVNWAGRLRLFKNFSSKLVKHLESEIDEFGARAIVNFVDSHVYPSLPDLVLKLFAMTQHPSSRSKYYYFILEERFVVDDVHVFLTHGKLAMVLSKDLNESYTSETPPDSPSSSTSTSTSASSSSSHSSSPSSPSPPSSSSSSSSSDEKDEL